MSNVPAEDKMEFIGWVLRNKSFKRRECIWILDYVMSNEHILKHVHFVPEAHYCPRAMVMSVKGTDSVPFRFYKGNLMTADADKAFHDLRLFSGEPLYFQINFSVNPMEYVVVMEDNPFIPEHLKVSEGDKKVAEDLINKITDEALEKYRIEEIDKALDNGDKELFMTLTSKEGEIKV